MIISPSLLMLAIQVVQQIQKDARMREAADKIHGEVGHLMDDLRRLQERVSKLKSHFGQANDDLKHLEISAEKIEKRGARIRDADFGEDVTEGAPMLAVPAARRLQAGE
jgi:DNA recombination protein RmuC